MPKQTYKINRFEGGLNRQSDPRDINDNELSMAWGINVDDVGVLKVGGGMGIPNHGPTTHGLDPVNVPTVDIKSHMAGYGLTHFSSDFDLDNNRIETDFTVLAKSDSRINIIQYAADGSSDSPPTVSENHINLGGSADPQIQYYVADGGLRCYDADFGNTNNTNKVLMKINRKMFFDAKSSVEDVTHENNYSNYDAEYTIDEVFVADSSITAKNNEGAYGQNYGDSTGGVVTKPSYVVLRNNTEVGAPALSQLNGGIHGGTFYPFSNDAYNGHSIAAGGDGLGHKIAIDFSQDTDADGTIDPLFVEKWQFSVVFIYDGSQPSIPVPVRQYGGTEGGEIRTGDWTGFTGMPYGNFSFAWNAGIPDDEVLINPVYGYYGRDINLTSWNPRITGFDVYMKSIEASDIGTDELFLIYEVNFETGRFRCPARSAATKEFQLEVTKSISDAGHKGFITSPDLFYFEQFPGETFESKFGYKPKTDFYTKFKTAAVANRRTYIGNVAITNVDGTIKESFNDRMIKSPVNQFDTFPEDNHVDVSINDGDSIVALEEFADRILQFKNRHMYIVNVSQDFEFLEAEHKMMGIKHPCQLCHTPHGVAWINDRGCHFYDGKGIKNLIDGKIPPGRPMQFEDGDEILDDGIGDKRLAKSPLAASWDDEGSVTYSHGGKDVTKYNKYKGWAAFMNSDLEYIQDGSDNYQRGSLPSIGYDEQSQKLIIMRSLNAQGYDSGTNWVYSYDFKTNSWILNPWAYHMSNYHDSKTNFSNNSRGELILYSSWAANAQNLTDNVGFYKWTDDFTTRVAARMDDNDTRLPVMFMTKDIDFGDAAVRKKVYKVYITYRSSGDTDIKIRYGVNGEKGDSSGGNVRYLSKTFAFDSDNNFTSGALMSTGGEWKTIFIKPATSSHANNIKSFRLQFHRGSIGSTALPLDNFAINDIAIVYRAKNVN